jgi:hypothetical protein
MAKPLRCYLRLHRWRSQSNDDGFVYEHCSGCGRDRFPESDDAIDNMRGFPGGGTGVAGM